MLPKVSVICLCYNHARFVKEAIQSVRNQTYANVELIIVDDASTDNSVEVIRESVQSFADVKFLSLEQNVGNCKAFNQGLRVALGDFIIDLAADDVLLPTRIEKGVQKLVHAGKDFGLNFSDAEWINESGQHLYNHSDRFPHEQVPQGDVYRELISRYFICAPSVMFTRELITTLNGYDESLTYEDFDLWIRGSRQYKFGYTSEVLVKKRVVKNSKSERQFKRNDLQRYSTYAVCRKIMNLNRTQAEQQALQERIRYEMKLCLKVLDLKLMYRYFLLGRENKKLVYRPD